MNYEHPPSPDTLIMLECLREAVAEELDRKRRLGQYAVFWDWDSKQPVLIGEDAPPTQDRNAD